jgi:hypothetical protein
MLESVTRSANHFFCFLQAAGFSGVLVDDNTMYGIFRHLPTSEFEAPQFHFAYFSVNKSMLDIRVLDQAIFVDCQHNEKPFIGVEMQLRRSLVGRQVPTCRDVAAQCTICAFLLAVGHDDLTGCKADIFIGKVSAVVVVVDCRGVESELIDFATTRRITVSYPAQNCDWDAR